MQIVEKAYAKINLGLKVLGKREDGYHEILTVMQSVNLHDNLTIEQLPSGIEVLCSHPDVPSGTANIVFRAVTFFKDRFKIEKGTRVTIEKNIPLGAGLGGGSSDAAAVLRGLVCLFGINAEYKDLFKIAASLGSDVPFFLRSGTAVASGRGEVLDYVEGPKEVFYVLIYPGFQISTNWAYLNRKIVLTLPDQYVRLLTSYISSKVISEEIFSCLTNDLEYGVIETYPAVAYAKRLLKSLDALTTCMTGSGSAVFGVFKEREKAAYAVENVRKDELTGFLCQPLTC